MIFQAACNRVRWPCGCATWYERASGVGDWVYKRWLCNRHEVEAWIAARDGEAA